MIVLDSSSSCSSSGDTEVLRRNDVDSKIDGRFVGEAVVVVEVVVVGVVAGRSVSVVSSSSNSSFSSIPPAAGCPALCRVIAVYLKVGVVKLG